MPVGVSPRVNVRTLFRMTVSTAVIKGNKLLLVREGKGSDRKQWNLPGGKVKLGEDLVEAAARETLEESGCEVDIRGITGIYCYDTETIQRMRVVFTADLIAGEPACDGEEILDVRWFGLNQLNKMANKHLSKAPLFRRILKDLRSGERAPVSLIRHLSTSSAVVV